MASCARESVDLPESIGEHRSDRQCHRYINKQTMRACADRVSKATDHPHSDKSSSSPSMLSDVLGFVGDILLNVCPVPSNGGGHHFST